MSKFRLIQVLVVLLISLSINSINAQISQDTLEEVVITDSKIERPARLTSRPVVIINSNMIQKYQGQGLDQLLEDQAGVQINGANSNPGSIKNIYVRGAAPGYTLILIDGLPASDPSIIGSTIDFRTLDINQVERVEIAKGSQSTLYGSDAIAGVINIITKKGGDKPIGVYSNLSYGSWHETEMGLSINGTIKGFQYNVGYQLAATDGFSEAFDPTDSGTFDKDGSDKETITANIRYTINDKWSIAPSIQVSSFDGDYDAGAFTDGTDNYESDLTNIGVRIVYDNHTFKLNAAFNNVEADRTFFTQFGDFIFNGTTQNADIFATYHKGDISLIGGVHYQDASINDDNTTEVDPSWNIFSPYANFIYNKNKFQIEAGLRFNNHSDFGSNLNYSITPSLFLSENVKLFASYATAFKAPALYELYGAFGANPALDPQTSATFEMGFKYYFSQGSATLTYFNRSIDDVILFTSMYENFAEQNDQGVELNVEANLFEGFNVQLSYTYLDGFTDNGTTETDNLYKRPTSQVGINVNYDLDDKLSFRLTNQFYSDRKDVFFDLSTFSSSIVTLKSYLRTDVSFQYKASRKATVFLNLNNVWGNDYFETYGFTIQETNARIGGNFSF